MAWFQRSKDNPVKRNLVFCYQDRPIGYIGYTEYDDVNMVCSPGAYLGETDVPIDAGITLFYIAVEYAFAELHMKSLETSVFKSNKQAMRIDKFLGYKEVPGKEEVYIKNGLEVVPDTVEKILHKTNKTKDDIGYFVFHQANKFMLEYLQQKCDLLGYPYWNDVEEYGNTVSSSIPIALADMLAKEKPQNPLVMSIGFGVGLSWGGCLINTKYSK